jgi:hypothetical protein
MKAALVILAFAIAAHAEVVTTYDSRTNGTPVSTKLPAIDIGITDTQKNPDFQLWLRNVEAPALANLNTKTIVRITGPLATARAELQAADDARRPAKVELEAFLGGQTPKQFRLALKAAYRNARTNTAFTAAQRRVLTNMLWAINAEDDYADLREAKRAEDNDLGIVREGDQE